MHSKTPQECVFKQMGGPVLSELKQILVSNAASQLRRRQHSADDKVTSEQCRHGDAVSRLSKRSPDLLQAPPEAVKIVLPAALGLNQQNERRVDPVVEAPGRAKRDRDVVTIGCNDCSHGGVDRCGAPAGKVVGAVVRAVASEPFPTRVDALQAEDVPHGARHLERKVGNVKGNTQ